MLTPDTEALITHHKVRVDAANNVRTHLVTTGEGPKALVIHGAPRTWNAFLDLVSPPVDRLSARDPRPRRRRCRRRRRGENVMNCEGRCRLPFYYRYVVLLRRQNFVTPPFYGDRKLIDIRPAAS